MCHPIKGVPAVLQRCVVSRSLTYVCKQAREKKQTLVGKKEVQMEILSRAKCIC